MTRKKEVATKTELKEVRKTLKELPKDKQEIGLNLISELEFMQETLQNLKKQVKEEGAVSLFKQGKQEFLREHPALKGYNTLISRYSLILKQVTDLIPKEDNKSDELMEFLEQ